MKFFTVQDYICSTPAQTQNQLNELRAYLLEVCPGSIDELKWGKPALTSGGILVVYAAANTVNFSLLAPIPKVQVQKIAARRIFEKEREA